LAARERPAVAERCNHPLRPRSTLRQVADGDQWSLGLLGGGVGWQPSRSLVDRAEAERAFELAERLGSVNAAGEPGGVAAGAGDQQHRRAAAAGLGVQDRTVGLDPLGV
jgi:hypothetical protein